MSKAKNLEITSKYDYNKKDDKYVIPVSHRVKPLVLKGFVIRAIRKAISNSISASETSSEICTKYKLRPEDLTAIKKAFDLTRDSFPLTDEEILEESNEQNVEKLLEEKRLLVSQKFEKEDWKNTQKDAEQWQSFVNKQLDPFQASLDLWEPPKIQNLTFPVTKVSGKTLVIGLSDIHWGSAANARYMYNDKGGWDTTKSTKVVNEFSKKVIELQKDRTYKFDKVVVLFMGDFLHSASGKTGRGTELKYDTIREEQFEFAMNSLTQFLGNICKSFPDVEVHTVGGNHNYEAELALYRAVEAYFRNQKNLKWHNYSSRPASFIVGSTLFMADHGADSGERAYVPSNESKLEAHVNSLLVQKPQMLQNIKSKIFLQGDKHHFKSIEFDNFEFIMFSTPVQSDEHAAVNNYNNRARQSCLVLDENGLKEIAHFYTDSLI